MNAAKTKALVGSPRIVQHRISTPAFNRRLSGIGRTYSSDDRQQIACHICGMEMQRRSIRRHLTNQHQTFERPTHTNQRRISTQFTNPTVTYTVSMPVNSTIPTPCPVPECQGNYLSRQSMRTHFQHRHWNDVIVIQEEGLLPKCERCLQFTSTALTQRHRNSKTCAAGFARKQRRLQQLTYEEGESTTIRINGTPIENVDSFRYLGRILTATGDDSLAVVFNLKKARTTWRRIQTILRHPGSDPKTSANFYKAVVQAILLYGSETWNITNQSITLLNGFHNNVIRQLNNNPIRRAQPTSDIWLYPNVEHAQQITGIQPITHYIQTRKTTLLHWAQNRPYYQLARHIEQNTNNRILNILSVLHTVYILNRLSTESLDWLTPYEKAFGQKPDISAIIAFRMWEPVYSSSTEAYPNTKEILARVVGIGEQQGDEMTWLTLDEVTQQVLCHSAIQTALDPNNTTLRAEHIDTTEDLTPENGENYKPILSVSDLTGQHDTSSLQLPKFSPDNLIGKTFVREMDDGNTYRAQIIQKILDCDAENHQNIKFLVKLGDGDFDEIITYNTLSKIIENQLDQQANNADAIWIFQGIKSHHGPITSTNTDYKGSSYNLLVEWKDGSETLEP
jgi:hypothetical protein